MEWGRRPSRWSKPTADASQEHLVKWTRANIIREVAGSLAMAVQRGNDMAVIEGYDRALHTAVARSSANTKRRMKAKDAGPEEAVSSTQTTDEQEDSGQEESEDSGEEESCARSAVVERGEWGMGLRSLRKLSEVGSTAYGSQCFLRRGPCTAVALQ